MPRCSDPNCSHIGEELSAEFEESVSDLGKDLTALINTHPFAKGAPFVISIKIPVNHHKVLAVFAQKNSTGESVAKLLLTTAEELVIKHISTDPNETLSTILDELIAKATTEIGH